MGTLLAFALALTIDQDLLTSDNVDVIEINHCYNEDGEKRFTQTIFWEWKAWFPGGEYVVVDYRIVKDQPQPQPRKDYSRGGYDLIWRDGKTWRRVHSISTVETWTRYDPEVQNRSIIPMNRRRGLTEGN